MTDAQPINISILDKDYKVACPVGEQSALLESARFLDHKMREMRDSGNIMGSERIAVITALNMANDLLQHQHSRQRHRPGITPAPERSRIEDFARPRTVPSTRNLNQACNQPYTTALRRLPPGSAWFAINLVGKLNP